MLLTWGFFHRCALYYYNTDLTAYNQRIFVLNKKCSSMYKIVQHFITWFSCCQNFILEKTWKSFRSCRKIALVKFISKAVRYFVNNAHRFNFESKLKKKVNTTTDRRKKREKIKIEVAGNCTLTRIQILYYLSWIQLQVFKSNWTLLFVHRIISNFYLLINDFISMYNKYSLCKLYIIIVFTRYADHVLYPNH